jgi:hypothetical protein
MLAESPRIGVAVVVDAMGEGDASTTGPLHALDRHRDTDDASMGA